MDNLLFFNDDGLPLNRVKISEEFSEYYSSRILLDDATTDTPSQLGLFILDAQRDVKAATELNLERWQMFSLGRIDLRSNSELEEDFLDSDTLSWPGWPVEDLTAADKPLDWLSLKRVKSVEINEHFLKSSAVWFRVFDDTETEVDVSLYPEYSWMLDSLGHRLTHEVSSVQQGQLIIDTPLLNNRTDLESFLTELSNNNHTLYVYPLSLLELWPDEYQPNFQQDNSGFPSQMMADDRPIRILVEGESKLVQQEFQYRQDDLFDQRRRLVENYTLSTTELSQMTQLRIKTNNYRQIEQTYRGTVTWDVSRPNVLILDGGIRQRFEPFDRFWIKINRNRVTYDLVEKTHQMISINNGVLELDSDLIDNISSLTPELEDSIREALGYSPTKVITLQDFSDYLEDPFVFVTCHRWAGEDILLDIPSSQGSRRIDELSQRFNQLMRLNNLPWESKSESSGITFSKKDAYDNASIELWDQQTELLSYDKQTNSYTVSQGVLQYSEVKQYLLQDPYSTTIEDSAPRARHAESMIEIYDLDVNFVQQNGFRIFINSVEYKTNTDQPDLASIVSEWYDQWSEVLKHRGIAVGMHVINVDSGLTGKRNRVRLHFFSRFPGQPLDVEVREPIMARYAVAMIEDWLDETDPLISNMLPESIGLIIGNESYEVDYTTGPLSDTLFQQLLDDRQDLAEMTVTLSYEDRNVADQPYDYAFTPPLASYWDQAITSEDDNILVDLSDPVGSGLDLINGTGRIIIWSGLNNPINVELTPRSRSSAKVRSFYQQEDGIVFSHNRIYNDNSVFQLRDRGLDEGRKIILESSYYPYSDGSYVIQQITSDFDFREYLLLSDGMLVDNNDWSDGPTNLDEIYPLFTPEPQIRNDVPIQGNNPTVDQSTPEALIGLGDGAEGDSYDISFEVLARRPMARTGWDESLIWRIEPEEDTLTGDFLFTDITGDQINEFLTQQPGSVPYKGRRPLWADVPRNLKGYVNNNKEKVWEDNPYRQRTQFTKLEKQLRIPDGTAEDFKQEPMYLTVMYFPRREGPHKARLKADYVKQLDFEIFSTDSDPATNRWEIDSTNSTIRIFSPYSKSFLDAGIAIGDRIKVRASKTFEQQNQPDSPFKPFVISVRSVSETLIGYDLVSGSPADLSDELVIDDAEYKYTLTLENVPVTVVDFQLLGQTEAEDQRLLDMNSTFRPEIDNVDMYAVNSYDMDQWGNDFKLFNEKRKEILETRTEIEHYIGGYRSIINSVYLFEHTQLEWFEYFLDVNPDSPTQGKLVPFELEGFFDPFVPGWKDLLFRPDQPGSENIYKKTDLATLVYKITDDDGRTTNDYTLKEVLVKLGLLKAWLVRQVVPMNIYLREVAGRHQSIEEVRVIENTTQVEKFITQDDVSPILIEAEAYMNPLSKNRHSWNIHLEFVPPVIECPVDHWVLKINTFATDDLSIPLDPGFDPVRRDIGTEMRPIQQIRETRRGDDFSPYNFMLDQQLDGWAIVECWVYSGQGAGYVSRYVLEVESQRDFDV